MRRILVFVLALGLLTACSPQSVARSAVNSVAPGAIPSAKPVARKPTVPHCATLVVEAFVDATADHPGAYDCLSATGQGDVRETLGITQQADFQLIAEQPPVMISFRFVRHDGGVYAFRVTGNDTQLPAACVGIVMNTDGAHVDYLLTSTNLAHC